MMKMKIGKMKMIILNISRIGICMYIINEMIISEYLYQYVVATYHMLIGQYSQLLCTPNKELR